MIDVLRISVKIQMTVLDVTDESSVYLTDRIRFAEAHGTIYFFSFLRYEIKKDLEVKN